MLTVQYPHGLKGDEISLEAKIVCVSDVVEAMSSFRPYRPARHRGSPGRDTEKTANMVPCRVVDMCLHIFKETGESFGKKSQSHP